VAAITDQSTDGSLQEQPDQPLSEFEIDPTPIWPAEDGRLEPVFLAGLPWVEFAEFEAFAAAPTEGTAEAPLPVEFEEFAQLDWERSEEEPEEPSPAPRQRASAISLLGSLGVHLPTLLVLILWCSAPAEIPGAIPVQLVVEAAPTAPDEVLADQTLPQNTSETPKAESAAASPAAAPPVPPPQPQVAEVAPPPKPSRPPQPTPAAVPKPAPPAPAAKPQPPAPNPALPEVRVPGSDATRGDYLDYLVTLTRGHFDILPLAFLAGRHGRTTLSVLVFEDGTISRVAVKHSSGYPDIDEKIEQMVAAVGRFPPVPESFKRPSVELDFNMIFPDALQQQ
jgi:periplasmic protein TonB